MSALRSLALAIELATRQREELGKQLTQAQRHHDFACAQMTQLSGYADDTQSRWATGAQSAVSPEVLLHHGHFMTRLRQTIELQTQVVQDMKLRQESARHRFLQAEGRLAGLKKIQARKQAELARLELRREQKATDEFAAQQVERKSRRHRQELSHGD